MVPFLKIIPEREERAWLFCALKTSRSMSPIWISIGRAWSDPNQWRPSSSRLLSSTQWHLVLLRVRTQRMQWAVAVSSFDCDWWLVLICYERTVLAVSDADLV